MVSASVTHPELPYPLTECIYNATGRQCPPHPARQAQAQEKRSCDGHKQSPGSHWCIRELLLHSLISHTFSVDSAFVDRADIVQFVGLPHKQAVYQILHSCLLELIKRNLIQETVRFS